jgi:hypothetical protein
MDTVASLWAGETKVGTVTYTDYPATSYSAVARFSHFDITGTVSGSSFIFTLPASTTEMLEPGELFYQVMVTDTNSVVTCADAGAITVKPNLRLVNEAETNLAALKAQMAGVATNSQQTMSIGDLQIRQMDARQLKEMIVFYTAEVTRYREMVRKAMGLGARNTVQTKFVRAP